MTFDVEGGGVGGPETRRFPEVLFTWDAPRGHLRGVSILRYLF